ncbi:metallophosphoesterase [Paenibacillus sp. 5J-6]|uniref:Metallophosphoesterase n=1 Tax=Paenibacillus silvestris TaxID=2606219 RepID=A0A6L8UVB2_9BACL|nr:metallophosphoesterase [Paenibacillus silvestris]
MHIGFHIGRKWSVVRVKVGLLRVGLSLALFTVPLNAMAEEKPELSFPVISDIHVQSWDKQSQHKFAAALRDLNEVSPSSDVLIINGDLTNGMSSDYDKLNELLKSNPHPKNMAMTMGNHEFYQAWFDTNKVWNANTFPNKESEQASIHRFLQLTGEKQVYYDRSIKGYHFIFLGSEQYRQSNETNLEDAYLSQTQLDWLSAKLKEDVDATKPVFVFLHQPLPYTVAGTHFCCTNNRAIVQHEELKKILSDHPQVIFFSGHTHWELKLPNTIVRDKFTMVNSSSVQQPWTDDGHGGEKALGPDESEGLYVEVYKDKLTIKGRDFFRHRFIQETQYSVALGGNDKETERFHNVEQLPVTELFRWLILAGKDWFRGS